MRSWRPSAERTALAQASYRVAALCGVYVLGVGGGGAGYVWTSEEGHVCRVFLTEGAVADDHGKCAIK